MTLPAPNMLGLPEQYQEWRKDQDSATEMIINSPVRFLLMNAQTGFGKSLSYIAAATQLKGRTCVLTSTKGLQRQLVRDYRMEEVEEIKGRQNYPCRLNSQLTCAQAPCVFGLKCQMIKEGGCSYYDRWKAALSAKIVVTNYAYYLAQTEYGRGLGQFEMLVLDEAHDANAHLLDHLSVTFNKTNKFLSSLLHLNKPLPKSVTGWKEWGGVKKYDILERMQKAKDNRKSKRFDQLRKVFENIVRIEDIDSSWVWEDNEVEVQISPTWAAPFAEDFLFREIPKITLTSATIVPKTADLMGVPKDENLYVAYTSSFPVKNRLLTHIPTVRMNYKNTKVDNMRWVGQVDKIIANRVNRKGIIHTISYARRDFLLSHSKYASYMITHNNKDTMDKVHRFKKLPAPLILVSPSMATGWDFPDDECRWQIILKLPYPSINDAITKRRMKGDKDFVPYHVTQQLIQACGRGVRSKTDWCETFILDNNVQWFIKKYKHLTVGWFLAAYRERVVVPKPITKGE